MLIKAKTLRGYKLDATDGEIGKVKEFYFDDEYWAVRYLVADTGNWLTDRQVLISPYALGFVNKETEYISINLNKKQIENSPSLDSDKPVSRQFEENYNVFFGWPSYWRGTSMWGYYSYIMRDSKDWKEINGQEKPRDPHLRSINDVSGNHVSANDGEIGHIEDFIIDDETWAIRYLIIDTQNFWAGKKVLISPQWIDFASWEDLKVNVNLSRESIRQSPEYSEEMLLTRNYETQLHNYYNRNVYWSEEPANRKFL
jgi:sporulation protein YlmC with PRC-barrel domain